MKASDDYREQLLQSRQVMDATLTNLVALILSAMGVGFIAGWLVAQL